MINSLRFRVIFVLALTSIIGGITAIFFFSKDFNGHLDTLNDRTLRGQLSDLERHLSVKEGLITIELPSILSDQYFYSGGQFVFAINSEEGFLFGSPTIQDKLVPESLSLLNSNQYFTYYRQMYGGDHIFQGLQRWIEIDGKPINIQVAQGPAHKDVMYDELIDELFEQRQEILIIYIISLLITAYLVISFSFRSMNRAATSAKEIDFKNPSNRLITKGAPKEMEGIILKFNEALTKIENDYKEQKFFLDSVSHEIRNPLASLKLSLEKDSDEVDSEVLSHEVNKIESVINALFELSRVENSSSSNFIELDLEDAARLSVTSFINHHNLENIELSFNVQTAKPTIIRCSQALFDILIKNLIENAIKALKAKDDDSKKAIEISIANNNLIVKDNGIGIGKNNFNSLLYQQKNKGFNSGLKLGLIIVKKICDLSDGIISAETINNETFFSISFKSVSIS